MGVTRVKTLFDTEIQVGTKQRGSDQFSICWNSRNYELLYNGFVIETATATKQHCRQPAVSDFKFPFLVSPLVKITFLLFGY